MEIRLVAGGWRQTVAVTMRTPGADFELAVGFLFAEGVIAGRDDVRRMTYCTDPDVDGDQRHNIVNVELAGVATPDLRSLERHFFTTSACGVCGKATLDALELRGYAVATGGPHVPVDVLYALPERLRGAQSLFEATGGLHAAGLFDATGELVAIREDVGRHNAVDKLVGRALLAGELPMSDLMLMVSGRVSFELVQKAAVAGVPVICAVSAPSSLAVEAADRLGLAVVGFVRGRGFNVYCHPERLDLDA